MFAFSVCVYIYRPNRGCALAGMTKSAIPVLDGAASQWITIANNVRLWDQLICFLNFASRFDQFFKC